MKPSRHAETRILSRAIGISPDLALKGLEIAASKGSRTALLVFNGIGAVVNVAEDVLITVVPITNETFFCNVDCVVFLEETV